jgi:hypothetical protein
VPGFRIAAEAHEIHRRSAVALGFAVVALLTTIPVWLTIPQVPPGAIRYAQWPIYVFAGTLVNAYVVALLAAATLRRSGRATLTLGLIGLGSLIVLYAPYWCVASNLINVYFSRQFGQFNGGPDFVFTMAAAIVGIFSVVMAVGFALAALTAEQTPASPS